MSFAKLSIQLGVGFAAVGGVGSGVGYLLLNNVAEYLVEVVREDETDSHIHGNNFDRRQQSLMLDEIKGRNEKNYFCQWFNDESQIKKDKQCQLIKLDFDGTKSLNLAQISRMNNEIVKSSEYFQEIWFKLKISKDYEFKIEQPIEIKIVNTNNNNKIFTTLIPKFKISSSPIQGNVNWFLTKLDEVNTVNLNIYDNRNYHCGWIAKNKSHEIISSFKIPSQISLDPNFRLTHCYIDEFISMKQKSTINEKMNELNLNNTQSISTPKTQITYEKKGNYFLIRLQKTSYDLIDKSISDLLKKDRDLIIVYLENIDEDKNIPFATFTIDSPLTIAISNHNHSQTPNLIFLN